MILLLLELGLWRRNGSNLLNYLKWYWRDWAEHYLQSENCCLFIVQCFLQRKMKKFSCLLVFFLAALDVARTYVDNTVNWVLPLLENSTFQNNWFLLVSMTPSVSNATESEKEEGSAWREGLVILGDRCNLVIKIVWRWFFFIKATFPLISWQYQVTCPW